MVTYKNQREKIRSFKAVGEELVCSQFWFSFPEIWEQSEVLMGKMGFSGNNSHSMRLYFSFRFVYFLAHSELSAWNTKKHPHSHLSVAMVDNGLGLPNVQSPSSYKPGSRWRQESIVILGYIRVQSQLGINTRHYLTKVRKACLTWSLKEQWKFVCYASIFAVKQQMHWQLMVCKGCGLLASKGPL